MRYILEKSRVILLIGFPEDDLCGRLTADAEVLEGPILKEYIARMIEEIMIPDFLDRR